MAATFNVKTQTYEGGRYGADADADASIYKQIQKLGKLPALLGIDGPLLWLSNRGWRELRTLKVMDQWDLRKRQINTGTQALDDEFDLLDLLSIGSWSGSVNIGIQPQPVDEANPAPAEVLIKSHSGSISVNFAASDPPEREYHVSISSHSGSIHGAILHGRRTSISSHSAEIDVQLTPYGAGDYGSTLSTTSSSGRQDIILLSPTKPLGMLIKEMSSVHSTASGNLVLRYPKDWEGTIEGHTKSGKIQVHGGDLEIMPRSSLRTVGYNLHAKKGNGNSTLKFYTGSGNVHIYFF
jgi:hypothetical protein